MRKVFLSQPDRHVAVIVESFSATSINIVEQNVTDEIWGADQKQSRSLSIQKDTESGNYSIKCSYEDTHILGWMSVDKQMEYSTDSLFVVESMKMF